MPTVTDLQPDRAATSRSRRNWILLRSMMALHPRPFTIAFVGAAVFALGTVASSFAIRWVIDQVILPRFNDGAVDSGTVVIGLSLVIGIGVVRGIGVVGRRSFASMGMWLVAETYTGQVVDRLVRQPLSWHRRHQDGDLVARAGVDTETTVSVIAPIPFAASTVLMIVVSTVWLFVIDVPLGLVAVVVFPLLVGTNIVYERSVAVHFADAQERLGEFSAAVHESFEGVQVVKAYGAEARETARLSTLAGEVLRPRVRAIRMRSLFESLLDVIPTLTNIALVVLGAARVQSGDVTIGEFSSVIFLFTLLVLPLRLIGYALSELPRSMAAWDRIQAVTQATVEADPADRIGVAGDGVGIRLDRVWYSHDVLAGARAVLRDVTLVTRRGSITALVGSTGSGKSTMADLVTGLVAPTSGAIDVVAGARCLVFQEPFLLAGSVRDNVEFGETHGDDDIWRSLQLAAADDFVRALPAGLDTVVGERGVTLSGGQRQRVALARAFVRRPALLVLDDTTSALDPTTEALVLDNLRTSSSGTTVLMVASRPSTIALADEVVFIADGEVRGHDTHQRLLAVEPDYRALVEAFETDRDNA